MVQIKISSLKPGVHEFELTPEAEELDLDPASFSNIRVDAWLDVSADRILVRLGVKGDATLECDRTTRLFSQPVEGTYTVLFARPELAEAEGDAFEDVRVLLPGDLKIDLTDAIRDTLLLSLPVRRIAPGAEEMEIETRFGAPVGDEAIDPRWEALRQLQERDNKD
jgi:uncharacterized protein